MVKLTRYLIKKHVYFTNSEKLDFLITAVTLAFMFSFKQWGGDKFSFANGIYHFLMDLFWVSVAIMTHILAQKIYGAKLGYEVTYKKWGLGLLIGAFLTIATNGAINMVAVVGSIIILDIPALRTLEMRRGINYTDLAKISYAGIFANLMLAMIFKLFIPIFPEFAKTFMTMNIILALVAILPIPPLAGFNIFFAPEKPYYGWMLGITIGISALLFFAPLWLTLIGAVVIGFLTWLGFNWLMDDKRPFWN